jgi:hypothetical protein
MTDRRRMLLAALAIAVTVPGIAMLPHPASAQVSDQRPGLQAATPERRQQARERWQQLTPEQQAERRAQARQRWEQMTPEQRAEARARADARRDRNQSARDLRQERRQPGDAAGQADARRDLRQDQRALRRERRDGLN